MKGLFFSAEDGKNTLRRRIANICMAEGLDPEVVAENLIVLDATDAPCLFHEVNDKGVKRGEVTDHYEELKNTIITENITFLIVDNASDTFGANPIDRQAVTKFIRALVALVRQAGGAVLLLSHVNKVTSKAGKHQTDTEGYADSAAWHNAARSRLFLNVTDDHGNLQLKHQKNNLGITQPVLNIAFREGGSSFYAMNGSSSNNSVAEAVQSLLRTAHKLPLLKLIHEFYCRQEWISPSPNSAQTNAFALLKKETTFPLGKSRDDKTECLAILRELERDNYLMKETYRKIDRHEGQRWALTDSGLAFIGEPMPAPVQDEDEEINQQAVQDE
jgi:hypothetical protein